MMLGVGTPTVELWSQWIPSGLVQSITAFALCFAAILALLIGLRFAFLPSCNRKHVTWGCGYTLPNTRMQYSGASFSFPMVAVFRDLLRYITREELPKDVFPSDGSYETHCVDSVERRVFNWLDSSETITCQALSKLPEDSRFSFAIGLVALILLSAFVVFK